MKPTSKNLSIFVVVVMLIGMYYNSYRYPFMINSVETSPTYSDTPGWLSSGKYLLIGIVLVYTLFIKTLMSRKVEIYKPFYALSYLYLSLIPIAYGIFTGNTTFIQSGIFFLIPCILHVFSNDSISIKNINKVILSAIYISIFAEIIQVFLFLSYGRLPALAYYESLSVRFGSFLDDPNGFGILLTLFVGFSMAYYRGMHRVILLILFFSFSLLTQSLTAISALLFSIATYMIVLIHRPSNLLRILLLATSFFIFAVAIAFAYWDILWGVTTQILESKSDSIVDHSTSFDFSSKITLLQLFGLSPQGQTGESGYINLIRNFGFVYLVVYVVIGLVTINRYFRVLLNRNITTDAKAFATGAFFFLVAVYTATINLPFEAIFPINLFLALILGLASSGVLRESSCHVRNRS